MQWHTWKPCLYSLDTYYLYEVALLILVMRLPEWFFNDSIIVSDDNIVYYYKMLNLEGEICWIIRSLYLTMLMMILIPSNIWWIKIKRSDVHIKKLICLMHIICLISYYMMKPIRQLEGVSTIWYNADMILNYSINN